MSDHTFIKNLKLDNFRNYQARNFDFDSKIIAISGKNGVGKTNILEAISLLSKGSGLKGSEFCDIVCTQNSQQNFTIYSDIKDHPNIENIGTSFLALENKRVFQINHKPLTNSKEQKKFPTIIWLTPQMDNLFCSSKTLRRKFLDKIVADIDPLHNSRINSYNHSVRERISLLQRFGNRENWLNIIERKIAELTTAIAIARNEAISYLNQTILQGSDNFTKSKIRIVGEAEQIVLAHKALEAEEQFTEKLKFNRELDLKSNRTNFGIHRSDITATLLGKDIEAKFCSTGEQKSILIALTFARIRMFSFLNLPMAILLLDEIASHLDKQKRSYLMHEISTLNCQSFLTATSRDFFSDLFNFDTKTVSFLELS
ncbi:MAG: DNA replication and repair protein RecF [Rickettsiales bacterium]|jgi:DNA replication and repair protein RecF